MFAHTEIFTLVTATIDFFICTIFAFRLLALHKEKPDNKLITYFMYYFLLFSAFIFVIPFYLPGFLFSESQILKIFFLLGFVLLFIISNLILNLLIFLYGHVLNKNANLIRFIWFLGTIVTWLYLFLTVNPANNGGGLAYWGFNYLSLSLMLFFAIAPFIAAIVSFLSFAFQNKETRLKFVLLAIGFIGIIIGGPLHQLGGIVSISMIADVVVLLGFVSSFLALLVKA